jgi:hypothetical protein
MQLNDVTEKITNNTRIILGKSAFGMYGVSDFPEEFTGDLDSCHILRADLRLQETVEADDLVNRVADGKYFSFVLDVGGSNVMYINEAQMLAVSARRKGETVVSTADNPITYVWTSSDESVATVDEYGVVTPVSIGYCQITCSIQQNPNITSVFGFNVVEREAQTYIDFITPIPDEIRSLETLNLEAAYYEDGQQTQDEIEYTLSRANENSYSYAVNGNVLTIQTYEPSDTPLEITASCNGYSTVKKIRITGR